MNFSTNNLCQFKNSKINIIEEEKNSLSHIDLDQNTYNFINKNSNVKSDKKTKLSHDKYSVEKIKIINENFTNKNAVNNIIIKENENNKYRDRELNSIDTLQEMVFSNEEIVRKTLPGLIITLILNNSETITEDFIVTNISPIMGDLRKPDGSRYKGNPLRVIKSALSSSGLFEKKEINYSIKSSQEDNKKIEAPKQEKRDLYNLIEEVAENSKELNLFDDQLNVHYSWTVKPKEAIQYLTRTIEKFQLKIIEKEKKLEEKQTLLGKKTKRIKCSLKKHNIQVHKIYNVLDDLLKNYKKNPELKSALKSPFNVYN